jgi:hypothetical protein
MYSGIKARGGSKKQRQKEHFKNDAKYVHRSYKKLHVNKESFVVREAYEPWSLSSRALSSSLACSLAICLSHARTCFSVVFPHGMAGHPCTTLRSTSPSLQGAPADTRKGRSRPALRTRGSRDRFGIPKPPPLGGGTSQGARRLEGAARWLGRTDIMSEPPCARQGVPHGQTESGGRVLAINAGAHAPRGGVTRQGVVLTDLPSLPDCQ